MGHAHYHNTIVHRLVMIVHVRLFETPSVCRLPLKYTCKIRLIAVRCKGVVRRTFSVTTAEW